MSVTELPGSMDLDLWPPLIDGSRIQSDIDRMGGLLAFVILAKSQRVNTMTDVDQKYRLMEC